MVSVDVGDTTGLVERRKVQGGHVHRIRPVSARVWRRGEFAHCNKICLILIHSAHCNTI